MKEYTCRKMSPISSNRSFAILVALSLCVLQAVPEATTNDYPEVVICKRQECPSYKVLESNNNFEIRSYKGVKWITGDIVTAKTYNEGVRKGFVPLFNYIRGGNEGKVVLNLTAPVLTDILIPKSSFQVYFLMPERFQEMPIPESDGIRSVSLLRKQYAAVRRFGGRINDTNISSELTALRDSISRLATWRAASDSTSYSAADYNPPFQVEERVNEIIVWFDKN